MAREKRALAQHTGAQARIEVDQLEGVTERNVAPVVLGEQAIERLARAAEQLGERAVSMLQHVVDEGAGLPLHGLAELFAQGFDGRTVEPEPLEMLEHPGAPGWRRLEQPVELSDHHLGLGQLVLRRRRQELPVGGHARGEVAQARRDFVGAEQRAGRPLRLRCPTNRGRPARSRSLERRGVIPAELDAEHEVRRERHRDQHRPRGGQR